MTLIYNVTRERIPKTWDFSKYDEENNVIYSPNLSNRVYVPDIVRKVSNQTMGTDISVGQYQLLLHENEQLMSDSYHYLQYRPDFKSYLFTNAYNEDGYMTRFGLQELGTIAWYFKVNEMYDQLLTEKMDDCIKQGFISKTDSIYDVQDIIEANMPNIDDVVWDPFDIRDFFKSLEIKAYESVYDAKKNPNDFFEDEQGYYRYNTFEHYKNVHKKMSEIICGYPERAEGISKEITDEAYNPIYYNYKKMNVINPRTIEFELNFKQQSKVAVEGRLFKAGMLNDDLDKYMKSTPDSYNAVDKQYRNDDFSL